MRKVMYEVTNNKTGANLVLSTYKVAKTFDDHKVFLKDIDPDENWDKMVKRNAHARKIMKLYGITTAQHGRVHYQ